MDKGEPKFKVDDWVVSDCNNFVYIESISETQYNLRCKDGYHEKMSIEYVDRCWHLWTIQDAKDGDVLANKYGAIFINAGGGNERVTLDCYCYLSVQNEFCIDEHKTGSWLYKDDIKPATKEQRDLLFTKMKKAGYCWDYDKKALKKIE